MKENLLSPPPSFSKKQLQENKEGISREGVGNKSVKFDNKKVFFESSIYFAVIIITLLVLFVKDEQLFTADSKTFNKYDSVLLICALLLETKNSYNMKILIGSGGSMAILSYLVRFIISFNAGSGRVMTIKWLKPPLI